MKQQELQTLKGFRDFLPDEKQKRMAVIDTITQVYEEFGFQPLETPTLEYASLLTGKYGDEADKLVYTFTDQGGREVGLRYDQTVPTARVLAQYQNELPRIFKRYQVQNVFRADKPQKGRYREFTQCDCDTFGADSPILDAELLAIAYTALNRIGFQKIVIEYNDRQTLMQTVEQFANPKVDVFSIIQSIDKLDKLSPAKVTKELEAKGLPKQDAKAVISEIKSAPKSDYIKEIEQLSENMGVPAQALVRNPNLARGLDYYTGLIFEVKLPEYTVGSVAGGGPYNKLISDLTGGKVSVPATGFAFGLDRVVEAAEQLGLLENVQTNVTALVTLFDKSTAPESIKAASALRDAGISAELYPTPDKLGKQFKLADQKNIDYALVIGPEEAVNNVVSLKNLKTGRQNEVSLEEAIDTIQAEATSE